MERAVETRSRMTAEDSPGFAAGEVFVRHSRHLHVDVDPVQERSGDPRSVAVDLAGGEAAFV
jgi:hypothetical protein